MPREIHSISVTHSNPRDGILIKKDQTTMKVEILSWNTDTNAVEAASEEQTFPTGDETAPLISILRALIIKIAPQTKSRPNT